MSHILFLTQVLPYPLVGGAKIRAYYMLRHLAQQHQITLVSFTRDDDQPQHIAHLEEFCHAVHTVPIQRSPLRDIQAILQSLITSKPISILRDRSIAMRSMLRQCISEQTFDIIHVDQTSMAQYGLFAKRLQSPTPKLIIDQHNAMHLLVERQASYQSNPLQKFVWQREARLFADYEAMLLQESDHILTVSAEDKGALLHLLPPEEAITIQEKMDVLPICVDPAGTHPIPRPQHTHNIIHIGTMFWPPNIEGVLWFAREVFPQVLKQIPDTHFTIVGKNPPASVQALASPNITVTGFVADPTKLLAQSSVFIVPVQAGGGMRVKILDGWQWGIPIVSTKIGAEGIAIRPGHNILLADHPTEFAQAITRLLTEPRLAELVATAGRQWVEEKYAWQNIYPQINPLYE